MRGFGIATVFLSCACISAFVPAWRSGAQDEEPVPRIQLTIEELRAQGIVVGLAEAFPNSCRSAGNAELSVSDEMLSHFMARGFSLESLCLGLSSDLRFDVETGRQLPLAFIPGLDSINQEIPLNLPDCYRDAVPRIDCAPNYDYFWGEKEEPPGPGSTRRNDVEDDAAIRSYIARTGVEGVFYTEGDDLPDRLGLPDLTYFKILLASEALPDGYGYAERCCEGDDPEVEDVDLSTYRKKRDAATLWSDQR